MTGSKYGFPSSEGMDLGNIDLMTDAEKEAFWGKKIARRHGKLMYPVTAYSFLMDNRSDMLKLHFRQMQFLHSFPEDEPLGRPTTCVTMLHWYACQRVRDGIVHEIRSCQELGASRAQINEVLGLAFMHSGPSGFNEVYYQAFDYMESYREPEHKIKFPTGWEPDPSAFVSGLDFDNPELGAGEEALLYKWYEDTIGYVPRSVQLLTHYNPRFMKANRAKFEGAFRTGALPKQMAPYIMIHYNMNRGFREGIREATLLGKAWGMRREHVVGAITLGTGYMAGMDALYIVDEAIGDILEAWE